MEKRLEVRIELILAAGEVSSIDVVERVLDAFLESDPPDVKARMESLKSGIEMAKTRDERILASLPPEEAAIARRVAAALVK